MSRGHNHCSDSSNIVSWLIAIWLFVGFVSLVVAVAVAVVIGVTWLVGKVSRNLERSTAVRRQRRLLTVEPAAPSLAYTVGWATGRRLLDRSPLRLQPRQIGFSGHRAERREPVFRAPDRLVFPASAAVPQPDPSMRERMQTVEVGEDLGAVAMILAGLAVGTSEIHSARAAMTPQAGSLLSCLESFGVAIAYHSARGSASTYSIGGRGLGGLSETSSPLSAVDGIASLVAAVIATHPIECVLDATLPADLLDALHRCGARVTVRRSVRKVGPEQGAIQGPFWLVGASRPLPPRAPLAVSPALVAPLLLAALNVPGRTDLVSPDAARWVPLFAAFGADIAAVNRDHVSVTGEAELVPAIVRLGYAQGSSR